MARIVLVADDSPTIQKKAVGILKGEGFDVETVSNGVAAIKRLGTIMPSVILADVSMPGRDGYEVCEYVKKSVQLSHVPVLLIASEMEPYDQARGAEVRADGIIKKPFEPQELISTVEKYAAKAEAALKPEDTEPLLGTPLPITPEPVAEFEFSNEVPEERPPAVIPAASDLSSVSGGLAFAEEPASEQAHAYSPEPLTIEPEESLPTPVPKSEAAQGAESASESAPVPAAESPMVVDESSSASEPVFIEEKTVSVPVPTHFGLQGGTMIFRAPVEIADPVWRDETVPAPAHPESAEVTSLEPQSEVEAPTIPTEGPVETSPAEPLLESPEAAPTSLEPQNEVEAPTTPAEAPVETYPAEPLLESPEEAPISLEPQSEVEAPTTPTEGPVETSPAEPLLESPEEAPTTPAEAPVEPFPAEPLLETPAVATTSLDSFSLYDATTGQVRFASEEIEASSVETVLPEPTSAAAAPEALDEAMPVEAASAGKAAPPEAPAEAEIPTPYAVLDWDVVSSIVHKVVVEMSPHALPPAVIEEIARRLTVEIASEFGVASPPPQA